MKFTALIICCLILVGCSGPVSRNIVQDLGTGPLGNTIIKGLQDSAYNFDSAVKISAISKDLPAVTCVHDVLKLLGSDCAFDTTINPQPYVCKTPDGSTSFTPRVSDLLSAGSVGLIRLEQLRSLTGGGGLEVSLACKAIVGQLLIDQGRAGGLVLPGGSLLRLLR